MSITLPESVASQLQFLVVEVCRQLSQFREFLEIPDKDLGQALIARLGYSYNLERRIEHACTDILSMENQDIDTQSIRSVEKITGHLQDIAEHVCKCTENLLEQNNLNHPPPYDRLLENIDSIAKQVKLIPKLLGRKNPDAILKSCEKHTALLEIYSRERERQIKQLKQATKPQVHIDTLFVAYEIQRMAEHLHMAYEEAISGIIGHPVNFEQLLTIKKGIKKIDKKRSLADINIETLALTKSGSTVSALFDNSEKQTQSTKSIAVFKDGEKSKLREELDSLEIWQYIYKGLTPQIYHFKKFGNRASMLVEHLDGTTFEHMLLQDDNNLRYKANKKLVKVLKDIYRKTQSYERKPSGFMQQLLVRLDAVLQVHPEFDKKRVWQRIEAAAIYEKKKLAHTPTVFIHGDFNIDNIIYNRQGNSVHFIDLRRSNYQDYLQDISVFLVSNYRLDYSSPEIRERIAEQINYFLDFARTYAQEIDDKSFEVRLALGLARSLLTSTRFISDKKRSETMLKKAMHLIDEVLDLTGKNRDQYSVDIDVLLN